MALDWRDTPFFEDNDTLKDIGRGLPFVVVGFTLGLLIFGTDRIFSGEVLGYLTNIWTDGLSIIITVVILDRLAERREDKRRLDERKRELIREAGSQDNATAIKAIRELWERGWVEGENGALQEVFLIEADLKGAFLLGANLKGAVLDKANLSGANLAGANLSGANFKSANLSDADLRANLSSANLQWANLSNSSLGDADITRANLYYADLSGAWLEGADLSGANLRSANLTYAHLYNAKLIRANLHKANLDRANLYKADLTGAYLYETNLSGTSLAGANIECAYIDVSDDLAHIIFDENTILPDDTHWSLATDLTRFGVFTDLDEWRTWLKSQQEKDNE